ncbi:ABC transporter ATP-binding protein [Tautonia plasticadhaerens]|uniref:Teichoic acids export ATP-binding protein TagH n=1 Tax=Tautonia plasticadhaerens TaxID=2527974 RepID=A0A518H719_9BACT|nr:ABC transporter ATP-binding protein [Tautonia plasticadhaerens]QDV36638.1 Teichoic acids export ATP-binding protein TagH [Tautonia plasticadhaerens]
MPDSDIAISVEGVSKAYRIGRTVDRSATLLGSALATITSPIRNFKALRSLDTAGLQSGEDQDDLIWALRGVGFELRRGEILGIVGRNGAGKSTLLKILSRVTEPTTGRIRLKGRLAALLEVGTGFNPELTGRENVYLNGTILGMTRREIDQKFDDIVDFSGVSRFLDTPVKRYSSGMKVRLGFGVAAHLQPDILIVDEVLAVGDAEFQRRCLGKIQEVVAEGRTILFVSHNMTSVLNLCTRGLLLTEGRIAIDGTTQEVVDAYLANGQREAGVFAPDPSKRQGDQWARIEHFEIRPETPRTGEPMECVIEVERQAGKEGALRGELAVSILSESGDKVMQVYSKHMGRSFEIGRGRHRYVVRLDSLPLVAGRYLINLWLGSGDRVIDRLEQCYVLDISPGSYESGVFIDNRGFPVVVPSSWEAVGQPAESGYR